MENTLRSDHPDLATMLSTRAIRLKEQVRTNNLPWNIMVCQAYGTMSYVP